MDSPTFTPPPTPSLPRRIWDGFCRIALAILRYPLTRLLLSLVVAGLVTGVCLKLLKLLHVPLGFGAVLTSARSAILPELTQVVGGLVGLLLIGVFLERARLRELGFPGAGAGRQVGYGFGGGAALFLFVVGLMAIFGWYQLLGVSTAHSLALEFGFELLLFLEVAIAEEVFFRGIIFRILDQWLGSYVAIALSAFLFGLAHKGNPGATWMSVWGITLEAGVLLAGAYLLFRSLWVPIGIHWAWNLFEGPVLGTPVSGENLPHLLNANVHGPVLWTGGVFGPEAGLLCTLVGFALGVAVVFGAHRRGQIFTPPWMRRLFRLPPAPAANEASATPS